MQNSKGISAQYEKFRSETEIAIKEYYKLKVEFEKVQTVEQKS